MFCRTMNRAVRFGGAAWLLLAATTVTAQADDWLRFRGPNGAGVSLATDVPLQWSETKNLKWKTPLPGPGFSSPIVVGDRVLVTCYSGYGVDRENPGEMKDLTRHLVCVDRTNGKIIWSRAIPAVQPEDPYKGFLTQHGYASHTPVSDGTHVYTFCGKSGVVAFDLSGKQLWQASVGTGSGRMKWGSAASPILYENLVIVNASDEAESLVALNKETGQEVWRATEKSLAQNWSTPVLLQDRSGPVIVMTVLGEIWGRDPATGNLKWKAAGFKASGYSASLAVQDGVVFCPGGMLGGSSFALPVASVSAERQPAFLWTGRNYESIISPVANGDYVYGTTARGVAYCLQAKTGKVVYQARLASGEPVLDEPAAPPVGGSRRQPGDAPGKRPVGPAARGGPSGNRPRNAAPGGSQGGIGSMDYASPVYADGKIFATTRSGVIYVLAAGPEFKILAKNQFASDKSEFCATPAILNDGIFIRSDANLYCVAGR